MTSGIFSTGEFDRAVELAKAFVDEKKNIPTECQTSIEACIDRVCKDTPRSRDPNISSGFWLNYTVTTSKGARLPKGTLNFAIATLFKDSLCKGPTRPSSNAIPVMQRAPVLKTAPANTGCTRSQVSDHSWVMGGLILITIAAIRIVEITVPETMPTAESAIQSLYIWMGIQSAPATLDFIRPHHSYYPDGA